MRALRLAGLLLAMPLAGAALAAPSAPGQPVELHIDALGMALPDRVEIGVKLAKVAATREEALKAHAEAQAALIADLAKEGVAGNAVGFAAATVEEARVNCYSEYCTVSGMPEISVERSKLPDSLFEKAGEGPAEMPAENAADAPDVALAEGVPPPPVIIPYPVAVASDAYGGESAKVWVARSAGHVELAPVAKYAAVTEAISAKATLNNSETRFLFDDRAKSHRAALTDGLKKARAEADAYAASIGYRVVRITGLSNRPAPFNLPDILTMMTRFDGPKKDPAFLSADFAPVAVDFVLAPK